MCSRPRINGDRCIDQIWNNSSVARTCPGDQPPIFYWNAHGGVNTQLVKTIGYPALLCTGTFFNGIYTVFLLWTCKKVTSRVLHLAAISISSIGVLFFELPEYLSQQEIWFDDTFAAIIWRMDGFTHGGHNFFRYVTNWTIIAFALERTAVLAYPLKFHAGTRLRFAAGVLLMIVVGATALSLPTSVFYYRWSSSMSAADVIGYKCDQTLLSITMERLNVMAAAWEDGEELYQSTIVPLATFLVLGTTTLILTLQLLRQQHTRRWALGEGMSLSNGSRTSGVNISLFRTVIIYFVTQTPLLVFSILSVISHSPYCYGVLSERTQVRIRPIVETLAFAFYAVAFTFDNKLCSRFAELWKKSRKKDQKQDTSNGQNFMEKS